MTNIFWFRRDLRVSDNRGLYQAFIKGGALSPVFIFDQKILSKLEDKDDQRVSFIYDSLIELKTNLQKFGLDLQIYHGQPEDIFQSLLENNAIDKIFANEDYEPYAKSRDKKIAKLAKKAGAEFVSYKDHVIFSGQEVLKKDGTAYKVFTPYKNEWLRSLTDKDIFDFSLPYKKYSVNYLKLKGLKAIKQLNEIGFSYRAPSLKAGEKVAKRAFKNFLERIDFYQRDRDMVNLTNSNLSVYLRFGCLSPREIVRKVEVLNTKGAEVFLSEIIWREFYQMILNNFPHVAKKSFKPEFDAIEWQGKSSHFKAWCEGKTGYPIIDAAMRCFNETGMMHNRLRMIVASFLVKDLLIDWRKGEKYFARKLLDFDLAANNGGWQWCASTGCDSQPYFRIFNPITQSQKFDPEGEFIKKYLPELKYFNKKHIHFPSLANMFEQANAQCSLGIEGSGYPLPIVDHKVQRVRCLAMYKKIK